uniref:Trichoplein keratin filament-binding protein n=1 Tax=Cynoglossus semilaevis TaxID=244447 RepID=A0A3P8VEJ6_CYNSE
MALPTLSVRPPIRSRVLAEQLNRQREREAHWRKQSELHARYFREQKVRGQKHNVWSSRQSFQQRQRMEEEKEASLKERRNRLRDMLQKEQRQLEAELREVLNDNRASSRQMVEKTEELRTAREERQKKLAQELLREHWKKNSPEFQEVETALHKHHVVSQWKEQINDKKQQAEAEQEERRLYENENERSRREALERIRESVEKRREEERKRAQELYKQIEELKLRDEETTQLKKEQDALLLQQWQLEKIEEERRQVEEKQKKSEMRKFLIRQYRTQLKRRAQQVQEELEVDRKILAALMEGEDEEKWMETARRERAVADAAWMKQVIEEQLQLEREREAEFDMLKREEAQQVWAKREAQWEKERKARELLMQEVFTGRQQQLEEKMQKNRKAQQESLRQREQLIQEVEQERQTRWQEKKQKEERRTVRIQELDAQYSCTKTKQTKTCMSRHVTSIPLS